MDTVECPLSMYTQCPVHCRSAHRDSVHYPCKHIRVYTIHVYRKQWAMTICHTQHIVHVSVYKCLIHTEDCFTGSIFLPVPVLVIELTQIFCRFLVRSTVHTSTKHCPLSRVNRTLSTVEEIWYLHTFCGIIYWGPKHRHLTMLSNILLIFKGFSLNQTLGRF